MEALQLRREPDGPVMSRAQIAEDIKFAIDNHYIDRFGKRRHGRYPCARQIKVRMSLHLSNCVEMLDGKSSRSSIEAY